jgi:hypothetical protein
MSLGALTLVEETVAGNGGPKFSRITLVGDGAYPAGGSLGFGIAFRAATKQRRKILQVANDGAGNGNTDLEYVHPGPALLTQVDPTTGLFTTYSLTSTLSTPIVATPVAHNLSAGFAVELNVQSDWEQFQDGLLPNALAKDTLYYVIASGLTSTAFELSLTSGGSAITIAKPGALLSYLSDKLFVRVPSTGSESGVSNQSGTTYGLSIVSY